MWEVTKFMGYAYIILQFVLRKFWFDKYQKPHVLVAKLFTIFIYKDLLRVLRY